MKRQFLELLEKDLEFRYAVAGYLGLLEILKRLDSIEEGIKRLWEEVKELREGQNKLWENVNKLWESTNRLWESVNRLWESTNKLWEEVRNINVRLARVERTLEKLTLDVEEEARIVVKQRLREMGYEVDVGSLVLPEVEVNIYGATDEVCVVGEASVRASSRAIDELNEKVELLKRLCPDKLRPRVLRVVYASLAMPDLVERARREGVWVLKATGDVVKPSM